MSSDDTDPSDFLQHQEKSSPVLSSEEFKSGHGPTDKEIASNPDLDQIIKEESDQIRDLATQIQSLRSQKAVLQETPSSENYESQIMILEQLTSLLESKHSKNVHNAMNKFSRIRRRDHDTMRSSLEDMERKHSEEMDALKKTNSEAREARELKLSKHLEETWESQKELFIKQQKNSMNYMDLFHEAERKILRLSNITKAIDKLLGQVFHADAYLDKDKWQKLSQKFEVSTLR